MLLSSGGFTVDLFKFIDVIGNPKCIDCNESLIVVGGSSGVVVLDADETTKLSSFDCGSCECVLVVSDDFLVGLSCGDILLNGKMLRRGAHRNAVLDLVLVGSTVISSGYDQCVRCFNRSNGDLIWQHSLEKGPLMSLCRIGNDVFGAGWSRRLYRISADDGEIVDCFGQQIHQSIVNCIAAFDQHRIVSCSFDRKIKIINVINGDQQVLYQSKHVMECVCVDSNIVACSSLIGKHALEIDTSTGNCDLKISGTKFKAICSSKKHGMVYLLEMDENKSKL